MSCLRAIHLGNIANNGYLNAKLLTCRGWSCEVVSHDYTHVMGCPEWEDADFGADKVDEQRPDWGGVNLGNFCRPAWFIDGPLDTCATKLRLRCGAGRYPIPPLAQRVLRRLSRWVPFPVGEVKAYLDDEQGIVRGLKIAASQFSSSLASSTINIAYSTSGWIPRFAGIPYVAFEHGTIRGLPFEDSFAGRMCADVYRSANHVLISNCDNDLAARRLGLRSWSFIPHPVNEVDPSIERVELIRQEMKGRLGCDFLILHPSRQHWEPSVRSPSWEKGNDLFIRGFADFVKRTGARAGCVMVSWGQSLQASRELLAQLGVADRVAWIPVQPGIRLGEWMQAADVVADQFWLGAFGSLTPKAMRLSCPVLLNMDEQRHRWCFPELPPVLNSRTPGDVADHLAWCWRDRSAMREFGKRSADWYRKYHSNDVIATTFSQVHDMLAERGRRERGT